MHPATTDKIYSVAKIAMIVDLLGAEGIAAEEALAGTALSPEHLRLPATRVSAAQVLQAYRNAARLSGDPQFAYHAGAKFSVSTYGLYGFTILSSPDFRGTMAFAAAYHQLATPLMQVRFAEDGDRAAWTVSPAPHLDIDARLSRFVVELQMAVHLALHRNIMGPAFKPAGIDYALAPPADAAPATTVFDCPVRYGRPENRFAFDAAWLDRRPDFANALSYAELTRLCDGLLKELALGAGVAGEVRGLVLANLSRPLGFAQVAARLNMSGRSLRRRLQEEGTSFRQVVDELRAQVAIKYVRDTDLSIEAIAFGLGFADAAAFRHAFHRWTDAAPYDYRRARAKGDPPAAAADTSPSATA